MNKITSAVKCASYSPSELASSLRKAVELSGDLPEVKGKTVLLKPNILSASAPEKAVTTHPEFVKQCVLLFLDLGAKEVLAGDSPGYHSSEAGGKKSGIMEAVKEAGGTWVDFSDSVTVKNPSGKLVKSFKLASEIKKADIIISLPKMKTHQLLYYTGAMKNIFGLVPGLKKASFHLRFSDRNLFARMIVDLNLAVKNVYSIMDGITAMEGHGPGSGNPRQAGVILASSNPLALDIAASSIMGYNPLELPVITDALERKYWLDSADGFEVKGEKLGDLVIKDFDRIKILKDASMFKDKMPPLFFEILKRFTIPRPVFDHDKCIECGYCVRICPAGALSLPTGPDSRVHIDYKKCINCYCCHEICPAKAISIKKLLFPGKG